MNTTSLRRRETAPARPRRRSRPRSQSRGRLSTRRAPAARPDAATLWRPARGMRVTRNDAPYRRAMFGDSVRGSRVRIHVRPRPARRPQERSSFKPRLPQLIALRTPTPGNRSGRGRGPAAGPSTTGARPPSRPETTAIKTIGPSLDDFSKRDGSRRPRAGARDRRRGAASGARAPALVSRTARRCRMVECRGSPKALSSGP